MLFTRKPKETKFNLDILSGYIISGEFKIVGIMLTRNPRKLCPLVTEETE